LRFENSSIFSFYPTVQKLKSAMKRPNVENGKEKIIAGALKLPAKLG
jgi:hypothetical protein